MSDWVKFFKGTERSILSQCSNNRMLIELIIENVPKGANILEAGCGTALLSLILADYGYKMTALDFSEEVLKYAKERICLNNLQINFIQGDILKLSSMFDKQYFSAVCHSGVMEHFSDNDIVKSLSEQRIVSRKVIFNVPNSRVRLTDSHFGDERFMSYKKWVGLIKDAGFSSVKVYGGYDVPRYMYFILPGIFFRRRFSFWWKWLSRHSIFVCQ